jgi:8-hydroxy-5-deazaflavin:NADPH oxidoreductase
MHIAVIGTGAHGRTYGEIWTNKGHRVVFGARDPGGASAQTLQTSLGPQVTVASVNDAIAQAEIVLLAVPWSTALEIAKDAPGLAGKVVIDPTNSFTPDLQLAVGEGTSVAEEISRAAPAAKVVKAFNTLGVSNVRDLQFGDQKASGFVCGDDALAKAQVAGLAEDAGFAVVDCGPLRNARALESLALLWGQLAYALGQGPNIAFKLLHR